MHRRHHQRGWRAGDPHLRPQGGNAHRPELSRFRRQTFSRAPAILRTIEVSMLARLSILKKLVLPALLMIFVGAGVIFYSMSSLYRMYDMMEISIELRTNRLVNTLEI